MSFARYQQVRKSAVPPARSVRIGARGWRSPEGWSERYSDKVGAEMPRIKTSASPQHFAQAVIESWQELYGTTPTKEQVAVNYAHWIFETGGEAFWNNNIANVKATQKQVDAGVDWMDLPGTWEVFAKEPEGKCERAEPYRGGRIKCYLKPGDPGRRFRSFPSLGKGMIFLLTFLEKNYPAAWRFLQAGDPTAFARALKDPGNVRGQPFYTGDENAYAAGLKRIFDRFMKTDTYEKAIEGPGLVTRLVPVAEKARAVLPWIVVAGLVGGGLYWAYLEGYFGSPAPKTT